MNLIDRNSKNLEQFYKTGKLDINIFVFYPKHRKLSMKEKKTMLKKINKTKRSLKKIRRKQSFYFHRYK